MPKRLVKLGAPDHVLEALFAIWRDTSRVSELIVYGDSMEPAIAKGAKVRIKHRLDAVAVGEVVVYKNVDHLTAHRVVEIREGPDSARLFVTRGDVNRECDEPIEEKLVLGKIVHVENPQPAADPDRGGTNHDPGIYSGLGAPCGARSAGTAPHPGARH